MLNVYSNVLKDTVEVSEDGTFELPSRPYTTTELKKISREINRAIRSTSTDELVDSYDE